MKTMRKASWSVQSIKQIVDNPIYIGFIRWGKYREWSQKRREGKTEEYIMVEGKHQAIITPDIWEKAQEIRNIRGKKNEKIYEGNFILTGMLKCPVCGASMVSHRTKIRNGDGYHRYYQCSTFSNKGASVCRSNMVNADIVENIVLNKIDELVRNPQIINELVRKMENKNKTDTKPFIESIQKIEKELQKIYKSKKENFQLKMNGNIDIETLNEFNTFLNQEEKELINKKEVIERELTEISNLNIIDAKQIQTLLENFNRIFNQASIEQKKGLLKSLISKIYVKRGDNPSERTIQKIKFNFNPEEIQALSTKSCFTPTYGTVHPSLS